MEMKSKKIVALILTLACVISLMSGCTKEEEVGGTSNATGRYLETEIKLPQEGEVLDIQLLDNGAIGCVMNDHEEESTLTLWSTSDYGVTWEEEYAVPLREEYPISATIMKDKTLLFVSFSNNSDALWTVDIQGNRNEVALELPEVEFEDGAEDGVVSSRVIVGAGGEATVEFEDDAMSSMVTADVDGEVMELTEEFTEANVFNGQDSVFAMCESEAGEVVVLTMMNQLLQIDIETGEILKDYNLSPESHVLGLKIVDKSIYLETLEGIQRYNIATGDKEEINPVLSDQLATNDDQGLMMHSTGMALTSKKGATAGDIYLADNTGIYRQAEDGNILEQIVSPELNALANPSLNIVELLALEDDSFLVHGQTMKTGGMWDSNLYHYSYSAEAKVTPETEVRIYALEDNRELRQAIAMYQSANPEVLVSLEVGMSGDDGITVADALNALNTEIMAGNGPDMLVLDGMPIESYIERGILEDISEIITKINEQDGIVDMGENTHAIATRLTMPYVLGSAKLIDTIENMATLQEASRAAKNEFPDKQSVNGYEREELMTYLYSIAAHNFITQDNGIEREALHNFLQQAKEIAIDSEVQEAGESAIEEMMVASSSMAPGSISSISELLMGSISIARGELGMQSDLAVLHGASENFDDMVYKFLTDDAGENIILTNTILGINSKSEQIEAAKEFLAFCLSKEAQMSEQGNGLPTNKSALRDTLLAEAEELLLAFTETAEDGTTKMHTVEGKQPTPEMVEEIEASLQSVRVGYANAVVQTIVIEQLMNYVEDQMTLEEAVDGIEQRVSLYLAE